MIDSNTRWILFQGATLRPSPNSAPDDFTMVELMDRLAAVTKQTNLVKMFNKETRALRLSDIKVLNEQGAAVLLWQFGDKNLADPAFCNMQTGDVRVEEKKELEGIAASCHMIISLDRSKNSIYHIVRERIPTLANYYFISALNTFFKEYYPQKYRKEIKPNVYKDGNYRAIINIDPLMAQTLREDLKRGVLSGVELVKHHSIKERLDEGASIVEETKSLKVDITGHFEGDKAVGLLEKIKRIRPNYDDLIVRYKRNDSKQKTVGVDMTVDDFSNIIYDKIERIFVNRKVEQCCIEIHKELFQKMFKLLEIERNKWQDDA